MMRARRPEAGMTLMEIMIAIAILVVMMTLAWKTIANTSESKRVFEKYEERNHELRMALGRVVRDFEYAYLSRNEDTNAVHPRTLFVAKASSRLPEVRFSTLGHRVLWADANESEQTVISYLGHDDPEHPGVTDWIRREQRRPSNELPDSEPADYDVLIHDIVAAKLEFWNWKTNEWQDRWDTTQADGQKGWLPSRVRITATVKGPDDKEVKLTTQARIWMQEVLNFTISGS
ncbi:MAG: prepilin-type N-terminal cleavage/methylation domain-containing protein [Deltaproteobacteria bacterium]|nr:MAG: prepilin-type N-terminal cleavage/methylation domain-containing protein [Deltaproteobacteria bacterium]